jgi:thiosulfate/3-mercaptopyruvate sulfurtransferase
MIRHFHKVLILTTGILITSGSALLSQNRLMDEDLLVSTDWLEENLADSLLVILHIGMKTDFQVEHIPGARFVSIWDVLVKRTEQELRHELPDEQELEKAFRSWGINDNSNIILCYQDVNSIKWSARLFYTLDYAGLGDRVAMLNGGLKAWKEEGRPVTADVSSFKEGKVDIRIVDSVRISKEEVLANLNKGEVSLVDARPPERYKGTVQDEGTDRSGHIEGAVNIPYYEVNLEDSTYLFKSKEALSALFQNHMVQEGNAIITYCGTGILASTLYFTARLLGYRVRLYDGSFQEWGNDDSLPVNR